MAHRPAVLCPVDFSDASRGALRYARAITQHFGSRLVILAVEDPLRTEAVDLGTGVVWDPETTRHDLAHFASRTLLGNPLKVVLWLVDEMKRRGTPLQAGDRLSLGAPGKLFPLKEAGKTYSYALNGLPGGTTAVSVSHQVTRGPEARSAAR